MKRFLIIAFVLASVAQLQAQPSHSSFDALLKKHVSTTGTVNYKGFIADKAKLNTYTATVSKEYPSSKWSEKERMVFWINVYNAYTIKAIVDHYPVKSITEIKPQGAESVWKLKNIKIGGKMLSLDAIENEILRVEFEDPRIHFAINCASVSCPPLRNEAFTAAALETQLTDQTRKFFKDTQRNKLSADTAQLSQIFNWFKADFTKKGSLIDFINTYSAVKLSKSTTITYLDYNWNLNE